jgi:hypothetical protein
MSITAKSVILDIADAHGSTQFMGIRSIDFFLAGALVGITTEFTAYATTEYSVDNSASKIFDTSLLKTGSAGGTSWLSELYTIANQRVIIVFDTLTEFDAVIVNNSHSSGSITNRGARNVVITSSTDAIIDTTYNASITNPTVLFDGIFDEHTAVDAEDPQMVYEYLPPVIYPSPIDTTTVKATNRANPDYEPWFATDPALSLIGSASGTSWYDDANGVYAKFAVDLGGQVVLDRLLINNLHWSGAYTDEGVKSFDLFGTNSFDAFFNVTDYADETDLTLIGSYTILEHVASDVEDEQVVSVNDTGSYRYFVLKTTAGYAVDFIGFRQIEFAGVITRGSFVDPICALSLEGTVIATTSGVTGSFNLSSTVDATAGQTAIQQCDLVLSGTAQAGLTPVAEHACNLELTTSVEVICKDVYPSGAFILSGLVDAALGKVAKIDGSLVLRSNVGIETYNDYINAGFRLSSRVDTFSEKPVGINVGFRLSSDLEALVANAVAIHSDLVLSSDLSIAPGDINNIIGKLVLTNSLSTAKHLSVSVTGNFVLGIKSSALAESSILAGGTTCSIPVHSSSRWS